MILTWGWPASPQGEIQVFVIRVFQDGDKRQELDKLVTAKDQEEGGVYCTWAAGERELWGWGCCCEWRAPEQPHHQSQAVHEQEVGWHRVAGDRRGLSYYILEFWWTLQVQCILHIRQTKSLKRDLIHILFISVNKSSYVSLGPKGLNLTKNNFCLKFFYSFIMSYSVWFLNFSCSVTCEMRRSVLHTSEKEEDWETQKKKIRDKERRGMERRSFPGWEQGASLEKHQQKWGSDVPRKSQDWVMKTGEPSS